MWFLQQVDILASILCAYRDEIYDQRHTQIGNPACFEWDDYRPDDPENTLWDATIVGAGMGGRLSWLVVGPGRV